MTTFLRNYLSGKSKRSKKIDLLVSGKYDLGVFLPSWDQRCLSIIESENISFEEVIVVKFDKKDDLGYRKKHDSLILNYLKKHSQRLHEIKGSSTDTERLEKKISKKVFEIYNRKKEPLDIFYDLSTSPRYYALSLISFLTLKGLFKEICYFYAEGVYPKEDGKKGKFDNKFTTGSWKTVEIPHILGNRRAYLRTMLLVSVGFEGNKTLQLVDSEEPDNVSVLFPGPGYEYDYNEVAYKFNEKLFRQYQITNKYVFKVHAGDAIAVWKKLETSNINESNDQNVIYLCCGTKPHALGMCLKAISSNIPIIKYRVPDEHFFKDIKPNGTYWTYKITDLSAF